MGERLTFPIPEDARTVQCRSCKAWCVWIVTANRKRMLVEAEGAHRGESHFAHCPDAAHFRKARR